MRNALFLMLLMAGCGGGGGSSDPVAIPVQVSPRPEYATDYQPQGSGSAIIVREDTREEYTRYWWNPGRLQWGDSVEHQRVRNCGGEDWYWLDGYSPVTRWEASPGNHLPHWPVETVRAEWINVDAGTTEDISRLCKTSAIEPNGQPFYPNDIPRSGHFRIRVWGWVWADGARHRKWYWQADLRFGLQVTNPCWQGSQQTRRAFETREAWVDDSGSVRGRLPRSPWNGDTPVDPGEATYTFVATNAYEAGPLWTFTDQSGIRGCLQSIRTT